MCSHRVVRGARVRAVFAGFMRVRACASARAYARVYVDVRMCAFVCVNERTWGAEGAGGGGSFECANTQ